MLRQDERTRADGVGRFKELLAVAALPVLTGYAAVATVLATVAAFAAESAFSVSGVLLAAGPGWLAAYQAPVVIGGHELGVLPLALTIGVCVLVARSALGAVDRLGYQTPRQAGVVIGTVAGTHAVVGVTIAVLANGAIVTADPLNAFGVPGLVAGAAATVGVARRCGLLDVLHSYVDDAAIAGMRAAALGIAGLLAGSALVLTVATAFAIPAMHAMFVVHAPGFGSGFGMLLLCLGYLPNAMLATLAFLLGPGFSLGVASLAPLDFERGPVPAVPLLAGLPESYAAWWPALLLVPALIGAGVGWTLRASATAPMERLRSVAVAGAMIGFATVVLVTVAGGSLGGGPFPGLLLPAGLLSVTAFAWIFLPGALVAWLAGPRAASATSGATEAEAEADDADRADTDGQETGDEDSGELEDAGDEDSETASDADAHADADADVDTVDLDTDAAPDTESDDTPDQDASETTADEADVTDTEESADTTRDAGTDEDADTEAEVVDSAADGEPQTRTDAAAAAAAEISPAAAAEISPAADADLEPDAERPDER